MSKFLWEKYYKINNYYHSEIEKQSSHLIPKEASVIEFGSKGGELLARLPNKIKVGVESDSQLIKLAKKNNPEAKYFHSDQVFKALKGSKFDYILISNYFQNAQNIQDLINNLKSIITKDGRIIVVYFSFLWKPFLDFGEALNIKMPQPQQANWLSNYDIENMFDLEGFEKIKHTRNFLIPYDIPLISQLANKLIARLPLIEHLCLNNAVVFRPRLTTANYSVSVIVTARNEEGSIPGVLKRIPLMGISTEVIFIEGWSRDQTYEAIKQEITNYKGKIKASVYKQKGKGKGDAVRLGFSKAKNDILMIQDGDLTVDPEELSKFYNAVALGVGDLVMGSRLVYPMESEAMRTLNFLGNKIFSSLFTYLLNQRIKDTLCGTKVLLKSNYRKIEKNRYVLGDFDPFGDFDLIFGAAMQNMKIVEIPVHYKDRVYGTTNISRFRHSILLFQMLAVAAAKLKFV